jgi:hypothetical protein
LRSQSAIGFMRHRRAEIGALVASLAIIVIILGASFLYYYVVSKNQVSALNGQVSTLDVQVMSLSSQLQSQRAAQCIRTGEGIAFHVRVATDHTNDSISGVRVEAIPYTKCASGETTFGTMIVAYTPHNGTVALPTSAIGGYVLIASYHGSNYTTGEVFAAPVRVTTVTLRVPSGNATVVSYLPV